MHFRYINRIFGDFKNFKWLDVFSLAFLDKTVLWLTEFSSCLWPLISSTLFYTKNRNVSRSLWNSRSDMQENVSFLYNRKFLPQSQCNFSRSCICRYILFLLIGIVDDYSLSIFFPYNILVHIVIVWVTANVNGKIYFISEEI